MDEWDDLIQGIGKSLRGRPSRELTVGAIRPLEAEDLAIGENLRKEVKLPTSTAPEILKLRTRHHLIAQLLAMGMKPKEVALRTGYSVSRISILQLDPTFKELLANYVAEQDNLTVDIKERLRHLSMDSIDIIQQRFDDDPEQFTNKELFDLAELTLDRTGHGKSATIQHTYGIDPESAALFKQNRHKPMIANLLEGELIDTSRGLPGAELDGISAEGAQLDLFAEQNADEAAGEFEESEVFTGETGLYSEGEAVADSEIGDHVPAEVREEAGKGNVIQLVRNVTRSPGAE